MQVRKLIRQRAVWVLYILFALTFGWLMTREAVAGYGVLGVAITLSLAFMSFANVEWAIYILTAYTFFNSGLAIMLTGHLFQAGIPLDVVLVITLAGLLVQKSRVQEATVPFFRSPIVLFWLVLFGYILLEGINPLMFHPDGWLQQVRKSSEEILLLFLCFCAFDTPERIKSFVKVFFVMGVLVGFYGCIQQWHGLFSAEANWVMADTNRYGLLFIMGEYRKFSTLGDPTTFGIIMAALTAFYLIVALFLRQAWKRVLLVAGCLIMMMGMVYSGTRTANVVLLAGLSMFMLLYANKTSTWVFGGGVVAILLIALNLPIYGSSTLNRFRSSFQGAKDPSFNVRELSRKFIQPYIYEHPFGGGIGTTNTIGKQINPGHYLAGFQTDDGYLKFALEIGWIGLLLICIWNFIILREGIRGYFRIRSREGKFLSIAALAGLMPFFVAMLAQDVIGQISNDMVIFPMIALVMRMDVFDRKESL